LKFSHYIGLSYLAALVLGVILVEQGKNIGVSLHPLFAILVWVVIISIASIGRVFGILAEEHLDLAHRVVNQPLQIDRFTRFVAAVQITAATFSLALILFYCSYKLNANFGVWRISDFLPDQLWLVFEPPTVDFALFCLLSAFVAVYATWVWFEIRIIRAAGVAPALQASAATPAQQSVQAWWRRFRWPVIAFCYLFVASVGLFEFFFLKNSFILNLIRAIDSMVGMK
jgi:hypothetical protein